MPSHNTVGNFFFKYSYQQRSPVMASISSHRGMYTMTRAHTIGSLRISETSIGVSMTDFYFLESIVTFKEMTGRETIGKGRRQKNGIISEG